MKKSTLLLIAGIVLIVVAFVADAAIGGMMDFSDASRFGTAQYATIAAEAVCLIVAVILIVVSRKEARKEKNQQ